MPIYEYRCDHCLHQFEKLILTNKTVVVKCPDCGGRVYKVFPSACSVHYKGPGFYTTEQRGITGRKRKPNIKIGNVSDLNE